MASVAQAMSKARHRNQITATSQPKDLERNLRNEVSGSSRSRRLPGANRTLIIQAILVDCAILHDDDKVLVWICDKIDILKRIAVDEQQIRKCADLDHTELAGIRIDETGESHQLAIVGGGHLQCFGRRCTSGTIMARY